MAKATVKRIALVFPIVKSPEIIRDIINLGCVDVSDVDDLLSAEGLDALVSREVYPIIEYDANRESVELLATKSTYTLIGWIPARCESVVKSMLSSHICAWELESPSPDEMANAPIDLIRPKLFNKLRSKNRRIISPLRKNLPLTAAKK